MFFKLFIDIWQPQNFGMRPTNLVQIQLLYLRKGPSQALWWLLYDRFCLILKETTGRSKETSSSANLFWSLTILMVFISKFAISSMTSVLWDNSEVEQLVTLLFPDSSNFSILLTVSSTYAVSEVSHWSLFSLLRHLVPSLTLFLCTSSKNYSSLSSTMIFHGGLHLIEVRWVIVRGIITLWVILQLLLFHFCNSISKAQYSQILTPRFWP